MKIILQDPEPVSSLACRCLKHFAHGGRDTRRKKMPQLLLGFALGLALAALAVSVAPELVGTPRAEAVVPGPLKEQRQTARPAGGRPVQPKKARSIGVADVPDDLYEHLVKCFPETADQRGHYEWFSDGWQYRTLPREPYYLLHESGEIVRMNTDGTRDRILWDGEPPDAPPDGLVMAESHWDGRTSIDENGVTTLHSSEPCVYATVNGKWEKQSKDFPLTISREDACKRLGVPYKEYAPRKRPTRNDKRTALSFQS
jgi:hypothetical protein